MASCSLELKSSNNIHQNNKRRRSVAFTTLCDFSNPSRVNLFPMQINKGSLEMLSSSVINASPLSKLSSQSVWVVPKVFLPLEKRTGWVRVDTCGGLPGIFFVNSTRTWTWLVAISVNRRKFSSALYWSCSWRSTRVNSSDKGQISWTKTQQQVLLVDYYVYVPAANVLSWLPDVADTTWPGAEWCWGWFTNFLATSWGIWCLL